MQKIGTASHLPLGLVCLVLINVLGGVQSTTDDGSNQTLVVQRFCNRINADHAEIKYQYLTCDQRCWVLSPHDVQVNVTCHKNRQLRLRHGLDACKVCRHVGVVVTEHLKDTIQKLLTTGSLQSMHAKAFLGDRQVFHHHYDRDDGDDDDSRNPHN